VSLLGQEPLSEKVNLLGHADLCDEMFKKHRLEKTSRKPFFGRHSFDPQEMIKIYTYHAMFDFFDD
jgi:hypothetical protein